MNNMDRNQETQKNTQGQGGRSEETSEGRENMRGSNLSGGTSNSERPSHGDRKFASSEGEEDEDFEEASLDSSVDEEDEEDMDLGGAEGSDIGVNRDRDQGRDRSAQI